MKRVYLITYKLRPRNRQIGGFMTNIKVVLEPHFIHRQQIVDELVRKNIIQDAEDVQKVEELTPIK